MFNGLSEFIKGDGLVALSVIAIILIIKAWKKSNWLEVGSVLGIYAIIVSLTNGNQILTTVGKVLRMIGIETGL